MLRAPGSFTSGLMLAVLGVGPSAPATKRGLSGRLDLSQAARARWAGRRVLLRHAGGAEGVGLDQVGACGQIAFVDVADQVGAGDAQQFVVALEVARKV